MHVEEEARALISQSMQECVSHVTHDDPTVAQVAISQHPILCSEIIVSVLAIRTMF